MNMLRRIAAIFLIAVTILSLAVVTTAAETTEPSSAQTAAADENAGNQPASGRRSGQRPAANRQIKLKIGQKTADVFGKAEETDAAPMIRNGRTMLPARFVAEKLGATVTWDAAKPNEVVIKSRNATIVIIIGSGTASVNEKSVELDSPAFVENGRTYCPLRFICENLGASVAWNADTQEVTITRGGNRNSSGNGERRQRQRNGRRNNGEQKTIPESPYGKTEIVPTTDPAETLGYCLYIPNNAGTEALPLIVYLHGSSLRGDDPARIPAADGLPNYVQSGKLGDVRAYVLSPQCPSSEQSSGRGGSGWTRQPTQVLSLIDKICEAYPVDQKHVILTGRSMGGIGTWSIACKEPERFSCIIPMTGRIQNTEENRNALSKLPVWTFVGGKDTTVLPESSMEFIDALKPINPNAKLTLFEDAGHGDVSRMAWLDESIGLLAWALAQ